MNFFDNLERYTRDIAIVTESKQISYDDLIFVADDIGRQIKKRCLIFVVCKNCFESIAGYIGFMRAGAVVVMIHNTIDDAFLRNLLEVYKPEYIYLPVENPLIGTPVYAYGSYVLLKTDYEVDYTLHEDLALLLTTSGSTGSPKFVRQSYKNINSNTKSIAQYLEITNLDRAITTMPMSYTYALSIINSHLFKGASIILTDATLMDKRFWETIKDKNATTFSGVPYIYEMLKKLRFNQMDLPSLRYITQAGGKLGLDLSIEFADICAKKN
ncbi:MAG: AMP-binding protein, partial [Candidatus Hodarchaeota archaeon]